MGKMIIGSNQVHSIYLGTKEVNKVYLGEHLVYLKSPYIYKWILNDTIDISTDFSYDVYFLSNGEEYNNLTAANKNGTRYLEYNEGNTGDLPYNNSTNAWLNTNYKTISFKEKPSGDLLTWLNANGTKDYDIIKAGTYTFKDSVNLTNIDITEPINYKFTFYGQETNGVQMNIYSNTIYYKSASTTSIVYQNSWESTAKTITLEEDQSVGHDFYNWFNENIVTE